jgi:hypothetical protein
MGSFFRSILTFFTLGMATVGCGKTDAPAPATDVTLLVPAMN